ncbi:hypothetical protein A3C21_01570 [Candidatus Kaiserbacteria bacterium RIFCSPHIGHO2_02_FULL_59_21]|uniref:C-type lysozyme inhibitor domain-containing protein n=2 Tax=Candidatus Kaiseribacteriota TaxID=1752734 RepID=A0A0G1YTC7_9BACT|nr:MAG: hypothetical protein UY98_C0026G0005 [Candidatus Kaiserbacteria bacterium GW2011_GWA2_58_9]OGG62456.1 MAG: hypothetical protein A2766_00600 [Candidatus Kaiserbacteria bacterium RIFCSPHIGHO2_01_FULL_58_22]OGG67558.1 MAG: hypothetical protein A3C21_01570 [Candidatus Kaiserbacteria bacterium RIFCSPHIGHO2_02_FULL_59_21]OGG80162.1 MAG: hypothetical protein A2952_03700 [Candidatus Kaiserbacteria bacterium RIFCSPLOWO2_01_FULL_59_34]OGG86953.1 MAG: hypothetical protein A3I47_03090 [Candidatus K
MKSTYAWVVALALILIGGYWFINQSKAEDAAGDLGSYVYRCEGGAEFTMTPASDASSIRLSPGAGASFAETTLVKTESTAGARYEGGGVVFIGAGEGVTLTTDGTTLVCEPAPSADVAPWNWGDAGEGGGEKQDVGLIVSESIVGKWQSVDDEKFTREFKADGTAVDRYDNESASSGTWKVFTKEDPAEVLFPIADDAVYIQMTMQGTQADKLNFKLAKLTPEELELVYMDRGGVLRFRRVQ